MAIISPYRSEYSEEENKSRMKSLKSIIRSNKLGFVEFLSRWVEDNEAFDERSLMIPNIDLNLALKLGKEFEQSSIIYKDDDGCREICTTAFETYSPGDIVRTYNISGDKVLNVSDAEAIFSKRVGGPVSKPVKGGKPFTLKTVEEIEPPRASYFHQNERRFRIY